MSTAETGIAPTASIRMERDDLGELPLPSSSLHGIHTARALENFTLAGRPLHPELIRALGVVKLAAARTNRALGCWAKDPEKAEAIERARADMADGLLSKHVIVDALQGGAGTSANLCVDEVIANRALELLGQEEGSYHRVSPIQDVNLHQSTNDVFPTALRLAEIRLIQKLEREVVTLQEAFQERERALAHVVKVGRTELRDATLTTLGREMGAWADAIGRDRWRIYKCVERLRVVNLGGTAIGTGIGAPEPTSFVWWTRRAGRWLFLRGEKEPFRHTYRGNDEHGVAGPRSRPRQGGLHKESCGQGRVLRAAQP